jgi:beta-glucanase (GH16 family)
LSFVFQAPDYTAKEQRWTTSDLSEYIYCFKEGIMSFIRACTKLSFIMVSLVVLSAAAPGPEGRQSARSADDELVWSDEFDGTGVDVNKWEFQLGDGCAIGLCGWGNNELQWYRAENARVENGQLIITAKREPFGTKQYTSTRMRTMKKGDWTYGRFEIRAKLPYGRGLWPAFWMLPTDSVYGGWAASGEIDIMELVGHEPNKTHGTLHYGGPWPQNKSTGASHTLKEGTFADDFHLFALEWGPGEIRWYVDGVRYQTQPNAEAKWWSSGGPFPAPFDQRFHLLLNLAVGGIWPGAPDATTVFPQTLVVDYVRVYQTKRS